MIDGSEKRNRQLAFEFHNSRVFEKRSHGNVRNIFAHSVRFTVVHVHRKSDSSGKRSSLVSYSSDMVLKNALQEHVYVYVSSWRRYYHFYVLIRAMGRTSHLLQSKSSGDLFTSEDRPEIYIFMFRQ